MKSQASKLKKKLVPLVNPNKQPPQHRVALLSVKSVSTNDVLDKFHKEKSQKRRKLFSIRPNRKGKKGLKKGITHNQSVPHFNTTKSELLYMKNRNDNQAFKNRIINNIKTHNKINVTKSLIKSLKDRYMSKKAKNTNTTNKTNKSILNLSNATALFKRKRTKVGHKGKKNISFGFYHIDAQEQSVDFDCDQSSPVIKRKVFDSITMDTPIKPKSEIHNRFKIEVPSKRKHELKRLNRSELKSIKRPEFPWKTRKEVSLAKNVNPRKWLIKSEFSSKRNKLRLK